MKALVRTIAFCGCLALAGCGGSSSGTSAAGGSGTTETSAATNASVAKATANETGPEVQIPAGPVPKKLTIEELRRGTGTEAKVGYEVTIRYVGVHWDGETYSNAWTYDRAPRFVLGARELTMPGLDKGIQGMKVGGRREIIIPGSARFTSEDAPSGTERELVLVYVVDLLKAVPQFDKLRALRGT